MKKLTINDGQEPPTLLILVEGVLSAETHRGDNPPMEALALAIQWLFARRLEGDVLRDVLNEWVRHHGPATPQKVLNFVKDHEMDAAIVAPLAIPAVLGAVVDP